MNVIITANATENLRPIYEYHFEYSEKYADNFQFEIDSYLHERLADNPKIGRVFSPTKGIRRLVYKGQYNIYYVLRKDTVYVIFIYDGQMDVNCEIEDGNVEVPELEG